MGDFDDMARSIAAGRGTGLMLRHYAPQRVRLAGGLLDCRATIARLVFCQTVVMIDTSWDQKVDDFYEHAFDESDPRGAIAAMQSLASERPAGDASALFEMGGIHDSLGLEAEAIQYYRAAIKAGLEGERATRVFIQLASTLRNVGESAEAVSVLESSPASEDDEGARQAFLALALYDAGRYGDALRTALLALIPTLDGYKRALREYAEELPSTLPAGQ